MIIQNGLSIRVVEQVEAKHRTVIHSNNLRMDYFEQPSATNEIKSYFFDYFLTKDKKAILS